MVLDGPLYLTRALIEPMVRDRYGRIRSRRGRLDFARGSGRTHLSAAKMGLIGMARGLASEFALQTSALTSFAGSIDTRRDGPSGIRVTCRTPAASRSGGKAASEIAATCLFLVSEDAGFITGQTIHVNGGAHYY